MTMMTYTASRFTILCLDCDLTSVQLSIRNYDNIIQIWNKNASLSGPQLIQRLKAILPSGIELHNPFYKGIFTKCWVYQSVPFE